MHKTLRAHPIERLIEEREVMRALPEREPDVDRRWVTRVPPDPHLRFDTNDYSLDPNLVGRRVEVRASQREIVAVALDTGELACAMSGALRRTARSPRSSTPARSGSAAASPSQTWSSSSVRSPSMTG